MKVYIAYDNSPARLPVAWADSQAKLARLIGADPSTIGKGIRRFLQGALNGHYAVVEVEDDSDDRD